jgi:repressor LexA
VDYNLKVLEDRGHIRRNRNISRGIEVVGRTGGLFGLRVRGHSMVDALIGDGDIVVLKHQETCENGETVAVWLESEAETTLKTFYLEGAQVRLQPQNATMDPIYTPAENVRIMGKLVSVIRTIP